MRVPLIFRSLIFTFALSVPMLADAQLAEAEKNEAIKTIAKHIAENYVYGDKGGQISSHLLTANHKGEFKKAATWDEFNSAVTTSIQKFSKDYHLYVKRDPAVVKDLKATDTGRSQTGSDEKESGENYGFEETKILENNVGYIRLSEIDITEASVPVLDKAMEQVKGTDALVIDLRNNGGGGSAVGPVLESYFIPENTALLEYISRQGSQTIDSTKRVNGVRYEKPVYILVSKNTASAAEAFAFVMQQLKRAKIVGQTTAGAANRNSWYVVNPENYVSVSTAATYLAGTQLSWEGTGVKPDIKVKNGDALEYVTNSLLK